MICIALPPPEPVLTAVPVPVVFVLPWPTVVTVDGAVEPAKASVEEEDDLSLTSASAVVKAAVVGLAIDSTIRELVAVDVPPVVWTPDL